MGVIINELEVEVEPSRGEEQPEVPEEMPEQTRAPSPTEAREAMRWEAQRRARLWAH